jgi:hypothetical protein
MQQYNTPPSPNPNSSTQLVFFLPQSAIAHTLSCSHQPASTHLAAVTQPLPSSSPHEQHSSTHTTSDPASSSPLTYLLCYRLHTSRNPLGQQPPARLCSCLCSRTTTSSCTAQPRVGQSLLPHASCSNRLRPHFGPRSHQRRRASRPHGRALRPPLPARAAAPPCVRTPRAPAFAACSCRSSSPPPRAGRISHLHNHALTLANRHHRRLRR